MADFETEEHIKISRDLVRRAREERESLLRTIEQSHKTIDRSQAIIAQLDQLLEEAEK